MKRREFITLLGGVVALLVAAQAQQPAKMKRIALVHTSEPVANMVASYQRTYRAFFDEVSRLGFVEGKNLVVERYSAGGLPDRYGQFVRDVVDTHPDAILSGESVLVSHSKLPRRRYRLSLSRPIRWLWGWSQTLRGPAATSPGPPSTQDWKSGGSGSGFSRRLSLNCPTSASSRKHEKAGKAHSARQPVWQPKPPAWLIRPIWRN